MNKDQKLLEEAYQKVLQEETNLEKALREIEASSKESEAKKEEKLKDLSQIVPGQLGTDEKGNFIYKPSGYEHGKFYKSLIGSLFDKDYKEVPRGTPVKEGMLWNEQDINTIKVYKATEVDGRLMKVEVPRKEVVEKGLDGLKSERELQQIADRKYNGNIDLARGMHIIVGRPITFVVKLFSAEQIYKALDALVEAKRILEWERDSLVDLFKPKIKEREIDSTLSKDFDIKALEDF